MKTVIVKTIKADPKVKGSKDKVITRTERDGKKVEYCLRTAVHEDFYVKFRSAVSKDGTMPGVHRESGVTKKSNNYLTSLVG